MTTPANVTPQTAAPGPGEPFDGATNADDLTRPLYGAGFGDAVKRFFRQYAKFTGRASRSEYWWVALFSVLVQLIPSILLLVGVGTLTADLAIAEQQGTEPTGAGLGLFVIGGLLSAVIGLALLVPSIAIAWRRLHDANFAGPFWFLSLTSVGSIIVLVFTLLPPRPEGRRFDVR